MPRTRPVVAGVAVAVVAMLATAPTATSHDQLISSDPESDARLDGAPTTVSLEYSADIMDVGAAVVVADGSDEDWAVSPPSVDGPVVLTQLEPGMPDGDYEVRWRVVSSDGHPIQGVVRFVVGDGGPDETGADPARSPSPSSDVSTDADQAGPSSQNSQDQTAQESEGLPRAALVGAGGALVALALLTIVQLLRRRHRADGDDDQGQDPSSSDRS
ncbi:copper resistance protein CopC [Isoptericola halotolerans]|uniref:copper resistance CopC family protein n=1 Tax=Isoptericola halotolerans TaxID=300560 RepID=UPI00388F5FF8